MSNVRVLLLNPAPALIKYGIKWGFEKAGCFVYLFDGEERIFDKSQEEQLIKITEAIKKYDINYIFCEGYSNMPIHEISKLCRANKIRFDFWTIEDPVTPHIGEHKAREKLVDFIWTTTQEYIPKYKALGVDSDLLLFACNPDFHKPVVSEERFKHDISLIGTNYSNRFDKTKEFIIPLIDNDFDIKIYGQWWYLQSQEVNLINYRYKNVVWEEPGYAGLPYEWLPIVVNSSKIMLGLNCSDESITQTSCRPYETLASSGESVYLAYYTEAQERLFGKYIYQAKTQKEMIEMAEMILTMSSAKRRSIALIAREYVIEHHNYKIRAEKILSTF